MIADNAFLYPDWIAPDTDLPRAISSLIRANVITLASTAIPIERIIPAIPGKVSVISKRSRQITINTTYNERASEAATPGTK